MKRVIFLIDGFNLYHAIERVSRHKWLDLTSLCQKFLKSTDTLTGVYYFTALCAWDQNKANRHRLLIQANEASGVRTIYGKFRLVDKRCRRCWRTYQTYEEKQTDVNIALNLFQLAVNNAYDTAIILSGDSDLIPGIRAVKSTFPQKEIRVIIPIHTRAKEITQASDFHSKIKQQHLDASLLPSPITLPNGNVITCPPRWV